MTLEELISPESVLCNAQARSKKHCLEILSELLAAASPSISSEEIFSNLFERERLGCTGLDKGTAFPHCRVEGLTESTGALIRLSAQVDFDTADGELVDLVFGLIVPADLDESHHADIRMITDLLNDDELRSRLRDAGSSSDLYRALLGLSQAVSSNPDGVLGNGE